MTTCAAPTAMHDGLNPRLYVHIAPRAALVLCDGCAASAQLTMDWRLDRRSDPKRPDRAARDTTAGLIADAEIDRRLVAEWDPTLPQLPDVGGNQ